MARRKKGQPYRITCFGIARDGNDPVLAEVEADTKREAEIKMRQETKRLVSESATGRMIFYLLHNRTLPSE